MPLYEYRCEACGAKEERLQAFSAPTAHDCPKCGQAEAMQREISRTAFVLSGSGWYAGGYGGREGACRGRRGPKAGPSPRDGTAAGERPGRKNRLMPRPGRRRPAPRVARAIPRKSKRRPSFPDQLRVSRIDFSCRCDRLISSLPNWAG
ncbi:MAG: zinc ribbon domain-containing protein [Holophagaceae bacterium]|nr:zinc ribbon domain-containing protein [Holophagaceae bacterium]